MEILLPVVLVVGFALLLLRVPKEAEKERKRVEEFATGLLARFSDADLVAEVNRRRQADPEGFVRRVETGEQSGESAAEALAAELKRKGDGEYWSGSAAGRPITS